MIKEVKPSDLKIGMFVMLELSWFRHSFPKSNFLITSQKQITSIIATKAMKVKVDLSKSDLNRTGPAQSNLVKSTESVLQKAAADAPKIIPATQESVPGTPEIVSDKQPAHAESTADIDHPAIDTVGTKTRSEYVGSDIDTVSIKEKGEYADSDIDTVTVDSKEVVIDSAITSVGSHQKETADQSNKNYTPAEKKETDDHSAYNYTPAETKESTHNTFSMSEIQSDIKPVYQSDFKFTTPAQTEEHFDGVASTLATSGEQKIPASKERSDLGPIVFLVEQFLETISNPNLPPERRAKLVYMHTLKMMRYILTKPTVGNLNLSKEIIFGLVDVLGNDAETADYILMTLMDDFHHYTHSTNVGIISTILGHELFANSPEIDLKKLGVGFFLHDLGYSKIPLHVTQKTGGLTDVEWSLIRRHPLFGEKILRQSNLWTEESSQILLQHHEQEDGSGYPLGLKGEEITEPARICRMANAYNALTSSRTYKANRSLPPFQALKIMKGDMVNSFNQDIFGAFVALLGS